MTFWRAFLGRKRIGPEWYRRKDRIRTRVSCDRIIAARVRGRQGTYAVFGSPRALDCTCGAPQLPCPHVRAVAADYELEPHLFPDLLAGFHGEAAAALERALLRQPERVLDAVERNDLAAFVAQLPPCVSGAA